MKLICPISGIEFFSSEHFKDEKLLTDTHPIFHLSYEKLLAKAGKAIHFGKEVYSPEEEKLLFLALLNCTNAVEWNHIADPHISTIKKHFYSLFKTVSWYKSVDGEGLKLPHFRVTEETYTLENIGVFIYTWYEIRQEWMAPSHRKLLQDILEQREYALAKLVHSVKKTEQYAGRLASWAMDAAEVPKERREEWTALMKLQTDNEILTADKFELEDLMDWMQSHLYSEGGVGHSAGIKGDAAGKVLALVDRIMKVREGGRIGLLTSSVHGPANTFRIKIDSIETSEDTEEAGIQLQKLQAQLLASGATLEEPRREDYRSDIKGWIRARANWILTASLRDDINYARSKGLTQ